MPTFLEHVARHILNKYGTNLSRIAVVFPNKRASLYLNDALARQAGCPLWSPAYITISDLFRQHSQLQVADNIKLICDLYRTYTSVTGYDETLDHFYGWGQLLLTDFDDIDKNQAPARQVFANLRDIHELDDISYLSAEQREIIKKFFSNFSDDHNTQLKERFLRLWSHIGDIYEQYNDTLCRQGLAYEGALYRQVAEDETISFDYEHYLFVGFNLLQQVEKRLFTTLRRQQKASFYWDYDHYYMKQEAGYYISQYLEHFPNEFDAGDDIYDCFRQPKDISFIAAPTENIQARYISSWLTKQRIDDGRRTAIVLCNENLLGTVIHCLPEAVENVNITTGYPLQQSPVSSLIYLLIQLQTTGFDRQRERFRLRHVNAILRHPYMHYISDGYSELLNLLNNQKIYYPNRQLLSTDEGLTLLFSTPCDNNSQLLHWLIAIVRRIAQSSTADDHAAPPQTAPSPFTSEALFRTYTLLNRLAGLVDSGDLAVDVITLQRLITQLIQQTSIPFHGEPAVGLQIMGVLETRNLDFDHVLLLSTNEGNMPRGVTDSSFIPYSIRKAFGLTTVDNKVAIYAYYFHRLLARAKDVTLVYNNATTDGHTGEMSRFMLQLLVESPHPIQQFTLQGGQQATKQRPRPVAKSPAIVETLRRRFSKATVSYAATPLQPLTTSPEPPLLTPTAINRYMRCPLQFYYCYVENLREPDDNDDDTIDNRIFGNIFHTAAQLLYQKMTEQNKRILASDIDHILKTGINIERCVDEAFSQELFRLSTLNTPLDPKGSLPQQKLSPSPSSLPDLNGLQIINRQVIIHYLRQLLTLDRSLAPFTILELEADVKQDLLIPSIGITTTIGGRIDRLDLITDNEDGHPTDRIRVIDYKTGSHRLTPLKSVEAIFDPAQLRNHSDYYLQTLLYARLVSTSYPSVPLVSASSPTVRSVSPSSPTVRYAAAPPQPPQQSPQQPPQPQQPPLPVAPALLFIQHTTGDDANPILKFGNNRILDIASSDGDTFMQMLTDRVNDIFDPAIDFTPTDDPDICRNCPYSTFCGR